MYKVILNDEVVTHDFAPGDRVCVDYRHEYTGTVNKIMNNGLFIDVNWDDHCKDNLGRVRLPISIMRIPTTT